MFKTNSPSMKNLCIHDSHCKDMNEAEPLSLEYSVEFSDDDILVLELKSAVKRVDSLVHI